jgi:16S rRNA (uracil1498-N3)-methyltransferase
MTKRVLCSFLPTLHHPVPLSPSEAHHAIQVLRLREGQIVEALDGKGHCQQVVLRLKRGEPQLEYLPPEALPNSSSVAMSPEKPLPITLEIAVLKGEAMEWVVEKAVELGASRLTPVLTAHTVVQVKAKGPEAFQQRWQKMADQALKQCGRTYALQIDLPTPFEHLFPTPPSALRFWCNESGLTEPAAFLPQVLQPFTNPPQVEPTPHPSEFRILIGPEGGWSAAEKQFLKQASQSESLRPVHLGPLILRAETAALYTLSLVAAHCRQRRNGAAR